MNFSYGRWQEGRGQVQKTFKKSAVVLVLQCVTTYTNLSLLFPLVLFHSIFQVHLLLVLQKPVEILL